ncbi:chorismate mutase [Streptomyces sp. NBC_00876]|uniref:chorismate mutase n=1 Tax=Streptomyces sp. NBC_00876 TaxID=2975853 RepID=UPI0038700642|nr:chorismate mutase [Streptomyces sp. NBC_00876]
MRPTVHATRFLTAGALMAALFSVPAAAAGPSPRAPAAGAYDGGYAGLYPLADLSAQRLATAGLVAAAKWGTGSPIDDPDREQQVLDTAARQAREAGTDPDATVRIFRDQIEANKRVQRALHRRWRLDPISAPAGRPDLADVRKEINRVNAGLIRAIAGSGRGRAAPWCDGALAVAQAHLRAHRLLDHLHATALAHALRSVCGRALTASNR